MQARYKDELTLKVDLPHGQVANNKQEEETLIIDMEVGGLNICTRYIHRSTLHTNIATQKYAYHFVTDA